MGIWSVRWKCRRYARQSMWRSRWAGRQSFHLPHQSMFQPWPDCQELWVVNKRRKLWIQTTLQREAVFRDRVRSLDIWRELRVELLFLCIKRRQLRWFRHLIGMPPRHPFRHNRLERPDVSLQNLLEWLHLAWRHLVDPPGGAGKCNWGEGRLEYPALACWHRNLTMDKLKKNGCFYSNLGSWSPRCFIEKLFKMQFWLEAWYYPQSPMFLAIVLPLQFEW